MALNASTGEQIWKTKVDYPTEVLGVSSVAASSTAVLALDQGKVFRTTLDADVIALDAKTGKELRGKRHRLQERLFCDGGAAGADGKSSPACPAPRPASEASSQPRIPEPASSCAGPIPFAGPGEPGRKTWPRDTRQRGGGSTWITGSSDPSWIPSIG